MSRQSSRGAKWERLKPLVWKRDNWTCTSCGNWLEREHPDAAHDATVDHVTPKTAGGRDELDNLTAMCRRCNGIKQDKAVVRVDWYNPRWFPERFAA